MMKIFEKRAGKKTRGQTMVEFALILPVLLMTMYGVMEFGRLLFIYITTASATREAARYAAAVGDSGNGVPYYNDCAGIQAAAQRVGILAGIENDDVDIRYDDGPGGSWTHIGCPAPSGRPRLGDRIVVTVTGHFEPIVPIVPISILDINSETARTIIRDLTVGDNFIIAAPSDENNSTVPPPYIHFRTSVSNPVDEPGTVTVIVDKYIEEEIDYEITVTIVAVDIFEAKLGYDYSLSLPVSLTFAPDVYEQSFDVTILDDDWHYPYYEQVERIVLYISSVSAGNIGYPRLHTIPISQNDGGNIPLVAFQSDFSVMNEGDEFHRIPVELDRVSGAPAWVDFTITGGVVGTDFTVLPSDYILYFNLLNDDWRTANMYAEIVIYPIDDGVPTLPKILQLTLQNPLNAELGSPDTHTLTIFDSGCAISLANPILSGDTFSVDVLNSGSINDNLSWIDIGFSLDPADPFLSSVSYKGPVVVVASPNLGSPVNIPGDSAWEATADLTVPSGGTHTLSFQFSNTNVSGVDLSVGFEYCPSSSIVYP
jgi:hypothetical protein